MSEQPSATIEALMRENRSFAPPDAFARQATISSPDIYQRAAADPEAYWADEARTLDWFEPWHTILEWNLPFAKWFVGGKLNIAHNCLDRHVAAGRGERVAYFWEGEPGDTRTITYRELHEEVGRCANTLKALGIKRGDRVAIYLPMIPELPVAMLACARIGAPHTVVFAGFSATALGDRINDAEAKPTVVVAALLQREYISFGVACSQLIRHQSNMPTVQSYASDRAIPNDHDGHNAL
jgi:acetyl-CoA synthetase